MNGDLKQEIIIHLLEFIGKTEAPTFGDTTWIRDFELDSLALFHFLLHLEKVMSFCFAEDDFFPASIESFNDLVATVHLRRPQT